MSVVLRKRKLKSGKTKLYLDVYLNGSRKFVSLKLYLNGDSFQNREILKIANAKRAKTELEIMAGNYGLATDLNRKASFIEYIEQLREKSRSKGMKDSWDNVLNKFKVFMDGKDVTFGNINKGLLEDFKDHLLSIVSQNTAQKYFSMIKTALYHAVRHEMISQNPGQFINIKKVESLPKFLTLNEVKKLDECHCENQSVKNAFLFSCFTGLRYGDVIRLTWDKVNDGYLEFTQGKTGNSERLPLCAQAQKILVEQRGIMKSERLLKEYTSGIIFYMPRQSTTDKALKRWAERAGIGKSISFHKARHTFATMSLTVGVDLYTTSKLLGHRDLRTTQIYAKVIDDKKLEAVNKLPMI